MPRPEASHSISKALEKSGKAKIGADVNFSFKLLKAFSCSLPQLKMIFFLTSSFKGGGYSAKISNKPTVETS